VIATAVSRTNRCDHPEDATNERFGQSPFETSHIQLIVDCFTQPRTSTEVAQSNFDGGPELPFHLILKPCHLKEVGSEFTNREILS
jgi:hypothetical protein